MRVSFSQYSCSSALERRTSQRTTNTKIHFTKNNMSGTPVADFYVGKTIFITGASGFVGKVLMEKLLYSCSDLHKIYVLIRPKRGRSVNARIEDIFNSPAFERLRRKKPDVLNKVSPLDGDLASENLGLKPQALELILKEVNVVFHCAATLKLEANLKDAVEMNTTGTWRLLQISKGMKNLQTFIHLSTAFCYADLAVLDERVHDGTDDPHEVMRIMTWMTNAALEELTPKLLKYHPNTYTYSKRLAECLVRDEYENLPVVIARPSIVIPSWEEPVQGWVDSLNGPAGVMLAAGKGVIRTIYTKKNYRAEFIPVDYAANALIVLAQQSVEGPRPPTIPVYNLTTNDIRVTTWSDVLTLSKSLVKEYPFDYPLWYPNGDIHESKFIHNVYMLLFHWLPAIFIDLLLFLFRQKRFMIRLQTRISNGLSLLEYFTGRNWMFKNDGYKALCDSLVGKERDTFLLDMTIISDKEYVKRCILGGRQYCLKEPLTTLPRARVVHKIMYCLDWIVKILFFYYVGRWILSYFEPLQKAFVPFPTLGSFVMSD